MSDESEREEAVARLKELLAKIEAMSPDEQAQLNELYLQNKSVFDFIKEILERRKDGSMSEEEALRWITATEGEITERRSKRRVM